MTQSRRKGSRRPLATEVECALREDRAQITAENETLLDRPGAQESLDLGHAGLRSACWAARRHSARRTPGPARTRTPLHLARPSARADARFTPPQPEFIE